ncbi:hypothetical protein RB195_009840 [Necator americanus]|uniref:C2H2-type domain-containing protein n=1 Tax=Necator americanus TaxID=51031 RepID=A0ABR1CWL7_NECAM
MTINKRHRGSVDLHNNNARRLPSLRKGDGEECEKGTSVMQCPECEYQLKDHRELVKHFDDFHADRAGAYTIESRTFTDYTSFKVWKEKLEEECVTRFATISRNIGQECTITYFRVRNEKEKFAWMDATSEADIVSLLKEGFKNEQILKKVRETADVQTRLFYTTSRDIGPSPSETRWIQRIDTTSTWIRSQWKWGGVCINFIDVF